MLGENKIHVSRPCLGDSFSKSSSPPPSLMPRCHSTRNSPLANCDILPCRTPSRTLISALAMRSSLLRSWSSLILTILHGSVSARLKLSRITSPMEVNAIGPREKCWVGRSREKAPRGTRITDPGISGRCTGTSLRLNGCHVSSG